MTLTFYIVSDEIQTKSKDIARMNKIAAAFKVMGHKTVIGSRNPNAHSHPESLKCTGKNDVFVCIFGGVDIEVISDHTGYKQSDWFKKRIKNAKIMYIYMSSPEGRAVSIANSKKIGIAHDGKGNIPGLNSIANPAAFLKQHGITWMQAGTTEAIVQKIKNNQYEGAGLALTSTGTSEVQVTEYTKKHGYDCSNHFEGYLKIDYSLNNEKTIRSIYVDFASESAETSNSFNNASLIFQNNKQFINQIPLLQHLKSIHDQKDTKGYKYYLRKVSLVRKFDKEKYSDAKLYDLKTDDATYKINLYSLGISSGEAINHKTLGVSGKSLLEALKTALESCGYSHKMHYSQHRNDDWIEFMPELDYTPLHTFTEDINGDIIGISNVKYSPMSDLVNSSIMVYDNKTNENKEIVDYRFARKSRITDILRYGEQTHLESLSDTHGFSEASQIAYDKLNEYYKPTVTFTLLAAGFQDININEFVETDTINPLLSDTYRVASRKIITDVTNRPMIQTEYGLGEADYKIRVKHKLAEQRKRLMSDKIDLNTPVTYSDNMADDFIEYTNEQDDIDYVNYQVWVDEYGD